MQHENEAVMIKSKALVKLMSPKKNKKAFSSIQDKSYIKNFAAYLDETFEEKKSFPENSHVNHVIMDT